MRRHRGPRTQDDLIAVEHLHDTRPLDLDADGSVAGEDNTPRVNLALDRQIGPLAVRSDVGHRGIDPDTVDDVARQWTVPSGSGHVLVEFLGKPEVDTSRDEPLAQRVQLGTRRARDRHRSSMAVQLATEIAIVLEPPEERQHLGERPFVIAECSPTIEVAGCSADEHSAVHGARTEGMCRRCRRGRA